MAIFFTRSSGREPRHDAVRITQRQPDAASPEVLPADIRGVIVNAGPKGVCIETDQSLKPGANVSIEMVPGGDRIRAAVYKVRTGKVVWCRKLGSGRGERYGAGIEIFERLLRTEIPVTCLI